MQRDIDIAAAAAQQYGVFPHGQAVELGFTPAAIQRRLRSGRWVRLQHGVYAIAGAPLTFRSGVLAATFAVGDAWASHRTAARLFGLDGFVRDLRVEVMVFDRRGNAVPRVVVHRPRVWLPDDRARISRIPVTSAARTLFDLAAVCHPRTVQVAFDDALRRQLVTIDEVASRLEAIRRPGIRGLRLIEKLVLERMKHPLEDSELEAIFRRLLEDNGLPLPVPQYEVRRDDDGRFVAELDFAYPTARVAIELDSWANHGGRVPFESDRVKQNELVDLGWTPYRFTKADLLHRARRVIELITKHVAASADSSGPPGVRLATSPRPRAGRSVV